MKDKLIMAAALVTLFALAIAAGKAIEAVTEDDHDKAHECEKKGREVIENIMARHNECVAKLEACEGVMRDVVRVADIRLPLLDGGTP